MMASWSAEGRCWCLTEPAGGWTGWVLGGVLPPLGSKRRRWGARACLCAWLGLLAVPGRGFLWSSVLCSCSCRAGRGVSPWTLGARNLGECGLCRASHVSCSVLSDTCAEMLGDFFTGQYWVKLGIGIP